MKPNYAVKADDFIRKTLEENPKMSVSECVRFAMNNRVPTTPGKVKEIKHVMQGMNPALFPKVDVKPQITKRVVHSEPSQKSQPQGGESPRTSLLVIQKEIDSLAELNPDMTVDELTKKIRDGFLIQTVDQVYVENSLQAARALRDERLNVAKGPRGPDVRMLVYEHNGVTKSETLYGTDSVKSRVLTLLGEGVNQTSIIVWKQVPVTISITIE